MRDAVGIADPGRPAAGVAAGGTDGAGASLLPASLETRERPTPQAVRLGDYEALRYRDVRVRGFDRAITLYATPTSEGIATVACYAPAALAPGFAADCERVAQTLEVSGADPERLAVDPDELRKLEQDVSSLNRDLTRHRRSLDQAQRPSRQAAAAADLAGTYASSARRLRKLDLGPGQRAALAAAAKALSTAGAAHDRLADAARAGSRKRYDAARAAVRSAESRAASRIAAL